MLMSIPIYVYILLFVTVQAKTSLVHTSKFATLEVHSFHMEGHKHRTHIALYFQKVLALCDISIDFHDSLSW